MEVTYPHTDFEATARHSTEVDYYAFRKMRRRTKCKIAATGTRSNAANIIITTRAIVFPTNPANAASTAISSATPPTDSEFSD